MAVYPLASPTEDHTAGPNPQPAIDIETLSSQAAQLLNANAMSVANPSSLGSKSVSLAIDLDEQAEPKHGSRESTAPASQPRRKLLRRDSLERREALLKGKEGSRRRTRWENDRLLNNPWAQPPLPSDWEVHPTYRKHNVPYYLAPLWDQDVSARAEKQREQQMKTRKDIQAKDGAQGEVPKALREKLKKAKAAKGMLRDLEEQVRSFVDGWEKKQLSRAVESPDKGTTRKGSLSMDSEDEEIVFIGRNGHMRDVPPSPKFKDSDDDDSDEGELDHRKAERDRLIFESLANDQGASFGRWLVHSIASYYGLRTWSRTIGDPARREAYVGILPKDVLAKPDKNPLPRPLWGMV